jgi:ankyrin repeat protein
MKDMDKKAMGDHASGEEALLVRGEKILSLLGAKHIHHFTKYDLQESAFRKPSFDFLKKLEEFSSLEKDFQNGENNFLSLLEMAQGKGNLPDHLMPEELKEGIQRLFKAFEKNTPVTAAPYDSDERKIFYEKLNKGYSFISNLMLKEYTEQKLDENQVFSCLEMISEGSDFCAGRWRQVLDELFLGFSDQLKDKDDQALLEKDRMLNPIIDSFYSARIYLSNKLSHEFVDDFYLDVTEESRLHFVTCFQRILNEKYNFNLPITQDIDPFIENERKTIEGNGEHFIKKNNIDRMLLDKVLELLAEKIKKDGHFYEQMVDFGKQIYQYNRLDLVKEDEVEFLSEDFFNGFSREIKIGALIHLLKDKKFIHEGEDLALISESGSRYIKKIINLKQWKSLEECLQEGEGFLKDNPLPNVMIKIEKSRTPLLTCLVGLKQVDLIEKMIKQGADVEKEDYSPNTFWSRNLFTPVHGRKPLHMAVLIGDQTIIKLLLENGADPFKGRLFNGGKIYTPFEMALSQRKNELVAAFVSSAMRKDMNQMIEVPYGSMPLINFLLSHKFTSLAKKLVLAGADIEKKDSWDFSFTTHSIHRDVFIPGKKPLHFCIETGDREFLDLMLGKGANPFEGRMLVRKEGKALFYTPMDYALENRKWSVVNCFLEHDIKKSTQYRVHTLRGTESLLNYLIKEDQENLAKKLILEGADVNIRDQESGEKPLHLAVMNGYQDLVECLIKKGADPFTKEADEGKVLLTPIELAFKNSYLEMVDTIINTAEEASLSLKPIMDYKVHFQEGVTSLLTYLIARGASKSARALVLEGANVNTRDVAVKSYWGREPERPLNERTPLYMAVKMEDKEMVKLLLAKGADPHAVIKIGNTVHLTPILLAQQKGNSDIVEMIKSYKGHEKEPKSSKREMISW